MEPGNRLEEGKEGYKISQKTLRECVCVCVRPLEEHPESVVLAEGVVV